MHFGLPFIELVVIRPTVPEIPQSFKDRVAWAVFLLQRCSIAFQGANSSSLDGTTSELLSAALQSETLGHWLFR